MVNRVTAPGEELEGALEYARILARSAPLVLETLKRFANETLNRSPAEAAAIAREQLLNVRDSDDGAEGRAAFAAKRTPEFKGR
jgi:1,4-dihydroxy-2-naphthoyl-CoA synthase